MAVLTVSELVTLRKLGRQQWTTAIDFPKSVANASFQSLEDWYEGERATVSTDIDVASSPKSFTNSEKKKIAKAYLLWKQGEGG